jgi:hypothetical protein
LRRRSLLRRRRGSRARRICATCCVCAVMRDGQEGVREVLRRDGRGGCGDKARRRQEEWAARDRSETGASSPVRHGLLQPAHGARDATRARRAAAPAGAAVVLIGARDSRAALPRPLTLGSGSDSARFLYDEAGSAQGQSGGGVARGAR